MTALAKALGFAAVTIIVVALVTRSLAERIGRVTSWWRTPWHNTTVGGQDGSAHILGWGVDIVPVNRETEVAARKVFPVVVNEGDHIHAAWFRS